MTIAQKRNYSIRCNIRVKRFAREISSRILPEYLDYSSGILFLPSLISTDITEEKSFETRKISEIEFCKKDMK